VLAHQGSGLVGVLGFSIIVAQARKMEWPEAPVGRLHAMPTRTNTMQERPLQASRWRRLLVRSLALFSVLVLTSLAIANVNADTRDDRRVRAGARLLRSLLAADIGIAGKTAQDGRLHVVVLGGDARMQREVIGLIVPPQGGAGARIRGLDVSIEARNQLPAGTDETVAVFLAAVPEAAELDAVLRYAKRPGVIVFSPFEGHVERGIHAGLSIEAKVRPYVNEASLRESGIALKPFFLRVAKVYR